MKKVRIGVVGLRFGASMAEDQIIRGPGSPYCELVGICDSDPERLDRLAGRLGVRAFRDLDALLAEKDIEAVGLFTGPVGRADLIRKIIRAGKDVMTTKPFELDSAKAASVLREAAELKRVVHLNSPCASVSGDFRQIEAWREKYNLGRPLAGRHETWYKNVERADGSWYDDPKRCPVAPIFRLGIYGINDMLQIFGEPESVQAAQSRFFTGRPTPDLAQLTIRFTSGAIASTLAGWCLQPPRGEACLTLYYENGTVHRNPVLTANPQGHVTLCVVPAGNPDGRPAETVVLPADQLSQAYQWDVFQRAVRGEPPARPTPPDIIVRGIRVIEAMQRSVDSGRTERV